MSLQRVISVVLVLWWASSSPLLAATFEISDGSVIVGKVVGQQGDVYAIQMKSGAKVEIRACDIVRIEPGPGEQAPELAVGQAKPLRFAGSNTIGAQLVPALAKAYVLSRGPGRTYWESQRDNERTLKVEQGATGCTPREIDVAAHGSGTAFGALASGEADVGMSSRPILPEERGALGDSVGPDFEHVLALDGIAVIVHPDNPVETLSREQIAAIFSGQITDWSQLGGTPGAIAVYARDERSGTYDTFKALVLKPQRLALVADAKRFESNRALSDAVASDPTGIGFAGIAYVRKAKAVSIDECGLVYPAHPFAVKTEDYPLARRLFLYTPRPSGEVEAFVEFALSDTGQGVVREVGFIDLAIVSDAREGVPDAHVSRMKAAINNVHDIKMVKDLVSLIEGAARLSTTFRFRSGSSRLDSRAARDIERLAAFMKGPEAEGRQLMLLGFSDVVGPYPTNLSLSKARAQAVATLLAQRGVQTSLVKGFGEEAPVACNRGTAGREKNRRVEVWLK